SKRDWSSDVCSSDLAVEHRRALLAALQADRGLGRQAREAVERLLGRAREAEERLCLSLTDEEIAHAREHRLEKCAGLGGRPEGGAIVDVEGHRRRFGQRALEERSRRLAEGWRDPSEVHHPRVTYRVPVHLGRRQPGERRIPPVVEDAYRAWRHPVLEEIDADARTLRHAHVPAIDAVAGEPAPDALAPRTRWQGGGPHGAQTEPQARGRHVGLGAAELQVELPRRLEARGGRNREPEQHLAEGD